MKTLKVDARKRVRLVNTQPGQVFAVETSGSGVIKLIPVTADADKADKPRFPRGSLLKYFTPDKDKEEADILSGCVQ